MTGHPATRHQMNFQPGQENLSEHVIHAGPFNIFALLTRNLNRLSSKFSHGFNRVVPCERNWPKRTSFQPVKISSGAVRVNAA